MVIKPNHTPAGIIAGAFITVAAFVCGTVLMINGQETYGWGLIFLGPFVGIGFMVTVRLLP